MLLLFTNEPRAVITSSSEASNLQLTPSFPPRTLTSCSFPNPFSSSEDSTAWPPRHCTQPNELPDNAIAITRLFTTPSLARLRTDKKISPLLRLCPIEVQYLSLSARADAELMSRHLCQARSPWRRARRRRRSWRPIYTPQDRPLGLVSHRGRPQDPLVCRALRRRTGRLYFNFKVETPKSRIRRSRKVKR